MNRTTIFFPVAIFSIFLGSQITEGFLLLPYWKTLSAAEFYEFYAKFGSSIGRFYTIQTIIAVLLPLGLSAYCLHKKSRALRYSLISTFFAGLIIALFYLYFKGVNQGFYDSDFDASQLEVVLNNWGHWHWFRVFIEFLCLISLILALRILSTNNDFKQIS